jgi:hypothetical protein
MRGYEGGGSLAMAGPFCEAPFIERLWGSALQESAQTKRSATDLFMERSIGEADGLANYHQSSEFRASHRLLGPNVSQITVGEE